MRLSETKLKEAILDEDLEIRQRAIRYFAKSFSTDLSVMPLVIKAVETFGRQDAYHLIGLPQTAETIAWIIDELNNEQSSQEVPAIAAAGKGRPHSSGPRTRSAIPLRPRGN